MLDIGFSELVTIGVVMLVVVGPERLPGMVRKGVRYYRHFRYKLSEVKSEVEKELDIDGLKDYYEESRAQIDEAIGYDELNDSLDKLRGDADALRYDDGFEHEHQQSGTQDSLKIIDADISASGGGEQVELPHPDEQADTPIEVVADKVVPANRQSD